MDYLIFRLTLALLLAVVGLLQVKLYFYLKRRDGEYFESSKIEVQFFFGCTELATILGIFFVLTRPIFYYG